MSQVHIDVKQALNRTDLIPLTEESFAKYVGVSETYQEIKDYLEKQGLSMDNIYETSRGLYTFWYIDNSVFVPIFNLGTKEMEMVQLSERIRVQKDVLNKYWESGNYSAFFGLVEKQFSFDVFMQLYDSVPVEYRYEVFIDLYTRNDYGFQQLDQDIVRQILEPKKGSIERGYFDTNKDGYVTVYRGVQSKSADPETAYSWTTNLSTAHYFATRFNSEESAVYRAKVHYKDIIDFITTRGESEVLVLPEDVIAIEDMGYYIFNQEFGEELDESGCILTYHKYVRQLDSDWFHNPRGIHGVKHIKRVLLHTLIMSHLDDLSPSDKKILIYASLYHDIGRTHDDFDLQHGKDSIDKMKRLGLPTTSLTKEDRQILEFIMEYHAKPDDSGIRRLKKTGILDKERALDLLMRFKDCDGLDRVRLGDLKAKYLRTETGKLLVILAHQLLRNIE